MLIYFCSAILSVDSASGKATDESRFCYTEIMVRSRCREVYSESLSQPCGMFQLIN